MTSSPLLQMRGLRIEAGNAPGGPPIVHGLDLQLAPGEVLGLIGESGAGKSTVGLAAMGYSRDGCRFAGGTVIFDGQELTGAAAKVRQALRSSRIAYVAQSAAAAFNPAWRIIDQHCEFPVLRGRMTRSQAEADAVDLYRRMRLPNPGEIGFRYPHQVSGGQLQRAMTAMAMACRPDLIIFDEPTTALDVTTQIEVLHAIRDAVDRFGTAAIYITHDLAVVAQMADRIMVLRNGELVEEAATQTMLAAPRESYTRSLWAVRKLRPDPRPAHAEGVTPLVSVTNLSAAYHDTKVLEDINLDFHRGRIVAVVGESGSGKSTLARTISGLMPPIAGGVSFDGEPLPPDCRRRSREQLRQTQIIFQTADTALNPRHTVREIIGRPLTFYLGLRGSAREQRIRQILSDIELDPDEFLTRLPGELSGGQKQRIGIARALAADPRFIICDEVTSALDQIVAEGILRLLLRLQRDKGLTLMFITHDISTVRAIADIVVVMQNGRVVEHGSRDEVLDAPRMDYTRRLLASVPEMDPDWLDRVLAARETVGIARPATASIHILDTASATKNRS
ncbi:ABC transporter ATP-binding protein [Oricola sp.]|uniref:ABC transporter ATP-binding protein n=1 Tax=Oricola sp. TaxID=1979950 RepID=UPI0025F9E515|nr:ABC transporter ATP-binding protein [Oricola sp.]MCI5076891.1 ABC transporter ATP-binding protein [Oricola sp.]